MLKHYFFGPRAMVTRLVLLIVACAITVAITGFLKLSSPQAFACGLICGSLSQVLAQMLLGRFLDLV